MKRSEVEKLIADAIEKLQKTHVQLITGIDLTELKSHALTLAFQESKFNEKAKNPNSTASGLFQILKGTRRDIEKRILKIGNSSPDSDIWKPDYNTYLAIGYLCYQYKRYKNAWNKAIIAYNLGSYKNQTTTAYLTTHKEYFAELFPNGAVKNDFVETIEFKVNGFK